MTSGTFHDEEGNAYPGQRPFALTAHVFVFGHASGLWFKMASVTRAGVLLETRQLPAANVPTIHKLTAELWESAVGGGAYSVTHLSSDGLC